MNPNPSPIHALLAIVLLILGAVLIFGSRLGVSLAGGNVDSVGSIVLLSLFGGLLWIWGCTHLAISSKLNPGFGILGIFFIVGLFVILWCAKKQPEWERAAARHRTKNPKKEYRGDPTSLY